MSPRVPPPPPECPGRIHQVRSGESLFTIARRYGVSLRALQNANPQVPASQIILPGQKICIPEAIPEGDCCLVLRPQRGFTEPGGVLWLRRNGDRAEILISATNLPDPAVFNGPTYFAVFAWGQISFDLPLIPVPDLPGVWTGSTVDTFPPDFFTIGAVDIFPGPVLGALIEECR